MALPPGFLDELRARVPISRIVGRKVVWDARKSNAGRGDWWAPCPFHEEKSPSFHVDDRKGFYYCFGCQAKGDALSFLREAEGLGFMEAVEALAAEAGMTMPARDPQAAQRLDRQTRLAAVMDQAVRFFRMQLSTAAGSGARDYLARRGLPQATMERFEIGYAPPGRAALFEHLRTAGVAEEMIDAAGLATRPETGSPYDRFRDRITFPIRDGRGRCIGFGARALASDAQAKYLNTRETELFDKGRSLYNLGPAREAVAKGAPLIVAEGYMDVIALSQAGFTGAVAPLGTAITEEQLRMLWRLSPEPVVALDGDKAGMRAGLRLIDLALPMMEAGQSLRFALLPGGQDPDDVLRTGGAAAMRQLIDGAVPMARLLWQRETEGRVLDSPERRAALDKDLRAVLARIGDASLRSHYGAEFVRLRAELLAPARPAARPGGWAGGWAGGWSGPGRPPFNARGGQAARRPPPGAPLPSTRGSALAGADAEMEDRMREALILAILITHPSLVPGFEDDLEQLECRVPENARLRDALLRHAADGGDLRARMAEDVGPDLENLFAQSHVAYAPPVRKPDDSVVAQACLVEEVAKLATRRAMRREVEDAMHDITERADERLTWRLARASEAVHSAVRGPDEDSSDLGEDRNALLAILEQASRTHNPRKT
ncbi:DNA primase [Rhodobaculum claviforme]|uniref:DNA primase n=1 Tax=Rhodobaculum claviforme TaxID=1549854 RepID=A0A934TJW2_9RHOB|nr:DNA primase [Rhodobaculum claviforme]MBK5927172.1 DNA primase [Rhodobaculum claviforme]